jgi:hypothetical protein
MYFCMYVMFWPHLQLYSFLKVAQIHTFIVISTFCLLLWGTFDLLVHFFYACGCGKHLSPFSRGIYKFWYHVNLTWMTLLFPLYLQKNLRGIILLLTFVVGFSRWSGNLQTWMVKLLKISSLCELYCAVISIKKIYLPQTTSSSRHGAN